MIEDVERMTVCSVCGGPACYGFGLTLEGVKMGDVGDWRCAEHHPDLKPRYTREEWAEARAKGKLYPSPSSPEGEWQQLKDIVEGIGRKLAGKAAA